MFNNEKIVKTGWFSVKIDTLVWLEMTLNLIFEEQNMLNYLALWQTNLQFTEKYHQK